MSNTHTTTLVIGLTQTNRLITDYVPMMDGYRDGAAQGTVTVTVDCAAGVGDGQTWAEAVFVATNAPDEVVAASPTARMVRHALDAAGLTMRALSVGDTVTVNGVRYCCARLGWEQR